MWKAWKSIFRKYETQRKNSNFAKVKRNGKIRPKFIISRCTKKSRTSIFLNNYLKKENLKDETRKLLIKTEEILNKEKFDEHNNGNLKTIEENKEIES